MEVQLMSKPYGSYLRTWAALMKRKDNQIEINRFLIKRKPKVTTMMNMSAMEEFFYPELGGIIVHKDKSLQKYKTAEEAYDAAVEIRTYLGDELQDLLEKHK